VNNACKRNNKSQLKRVRTTGLLITTRRLQAMNSDSDSRWFRASKSKIVRISRSKQNPDLWEIWLNNTLISGGYSDPLEAAEAASKKDFHNANAIKLFAGVSVPGNLDSWRETPPEEFSDSSLDESQSECRDRFRKSNPDRL
jgi:hypothetical protein